MTASVILLLIHLIPDCILRHMAVTRKQIKGDEMQHAQIDKIYFIEYMGYIEIGASACEALIEVANTNEVGVCEVFDALVREGLHNPCGNSSQY